MPIYLISFTIGPVQSFISQARKTHDLWAGSQILSTLTAAAIKSLTPGYQLVFPAAEAVENSVSIPNRFVAVIESESIQDEIEALENNVRAAFRDRALNSGQELTARSSEAGAKLDLIQSAWTAQIDTFLQIYWSAVPFDGHLQQDLTKAEQLLGSVKALRQFAPLSERGQKCSLCGERNILFSHQDKTLKHQPYFRMMAKDTRIHAKEGLCGICLAKRLYNRYSEDFPEFPSTTRVALWDTLKRLNMWEYS